MSDSHPPIPVVPLPHFMVIGIIQARLNGHGFQMPVQAAIEGIKQAPELFHYRALRNGRLLAWDINLPLALPILEDVFPPLALALKHSGIMETHVPFSCLDRYDSMMHQDWLNLLGTIKDQGPVIDTTDPNCEPIYAKPADPLMFLDMDTALDMITEAKAMEAGPNRDAAVAQAKELLTRLQQ
jgi:hypothetical protein